MMRRNASEAGIRYYERLCTTPAFGAGGFHLAALRACMSARRPPADPGVKCQETDVDGMRGEWVVAPGSDPSVRFLYLHGGGFVSGTGEYYLCTAAHIAELARCAVLVIDYRLAPEQPFPAGLEDCIRAHAWMRGHGPDACLSVGEATFIGGDSAGACLTMATVLALLRRGETLPAGAVSMSAFADQTMRSESIRSEAGNDPIMDPKCLPEFTRLYLNGADPCDPLASPVFGDYTGSCPLLIQVGEHEIIRDDSVALAASAEQSGADVTLEVWPGMFHVFQSHEPLLPDGREALAHIAAFMQRVRTLGC